MDDLEKKVLKEISDYSIKTDSKCGITIIQLGIKLGIESPKLKLLLTSIYKKKNNQN